MLAKESNHTRTVRDAVADSAASAQTKERLSASGSSRERAQVGHQSRASTGVPHAAWRIGSA